MLRFHDSLTKAERPFEPLEQGKVTMYNCGPTVYDFVHIGNLRSFVFADLLRRYMEHRGFEVRQVMNITDVGHALADADEGEDKLERAAHEQGKTPAEIAAFYTEAFFRDIDAIGNLRAHAYPAATGSVDAMITLIERLLAAGKAYKVGENVYYDVASFPAYGKLSGNTLEGLEPGARVEVRESKKHPADFALWIHNPQHVMQWKAPWGTGYPGWHIECSAMAMVALGETIDIHTGGEDNKFPHHEAEIAQSEGATGKPFARYWLHASHLLVEGEKMSKSKGNFYTLQDLRDKGYAARDIRYLLVSAHYRQQLNFTLAGIDAAHAALARLDAFVDNVAAGDTLPGGDAAEALRAKRAFEDAMDDDLNVSGALAAVFELVQSVNGAMVDGPLGEVTRDAVLDVLDAVGRALGFTFGRRATEDDVPADIMALIAERDAARQKKDFKEADRLRDEIRAKGWVVEDTAGGRMIKRRE